MTEREKLFGLFHEYNAKYVTFCDDLFKDTPEELDSKMYGLADHLLANGVRLETNQATSDKTSDKTSDDPMTNADKIRAMDDETLASQLVKVFEEGVLALTDIPLPYEILNEVRSEFLKKLKEPVEDK